MSKHLSEEIRVPIDEDNPSIMRMEEKCIKCGQCRDICKDSITVLGTYQLERTGDKAICIHCGQCANVCPVDSISEKYEYHEVKSAVANKDKVVIVSTSPSVRAALGEEFGMVDGSFVQGKMISLLRKLGVDYVLDTNFAADLTIVEEASELLHRVQDAPEGKPLPQFTSCCPAWVKYVETYYPDMLPHISSAKSPIGMQGPTIKTYFAKKMGIDPDKIINVALTPCTAKKFEIRREEMSDASKYLQKESMMDMDYVITTRELAKWAKEEQVDFQSLTDSDFDPFMGEASGAGVIFGNTGGVMEAAVRTAYAYLTKSTPMDALYDLQPVRGMEGIKEASLTIGDITLKIAVVYGISNARKVLDDIKNGIKEYHFIEVMTCPGGCIGGGGQPKDKEHKGDALRVKRIESLYRRDKGMKLRLSHENEELKKLYKEFYQEPLSELAEQMLHTEYRDRSIDLGSKDLAQDGKEIVCEVCDFIHRIGEPLLECPLCHSKRDKFVPYPRSYQG